MAYKLVRESSETPNITNRDDTIMVRYAYGDYNGVVKHYGEELSVTIDGSTATIHKGRAVVNGWEVDVDGNGIVFNALTGQQMYYSVIMFINLINESVSFNFVSNSGLYPEINTGDDLTAYPQGYRRIVTHHLYSENGVFVSAERLLPLIPYLADLEKRVDELGFKEGLIGFYAYNRNTGEERSLFPLNPSSGEYVYESYRLIKQGKMALLNLYFDASYYSFNSKEFVATSYRLKIGKDFYPKLDRSVAIMEITNPGVTPTTVTYADVFYEKLTPDTFAIDIPYSRNWIYTIHNFGWELK